MLRTFTQSHEALSYVRCLCGYALSQVESGTSLPVIQQLLGHSSLATTATYVSHIGPAKAVAEANGRTAHLAVQP
jgi:integrase